jgi:hypothetical protein
MICIRELDGSEGTAPLNIVADDARPLPGFLIQGFNHGAVAAVPGIVRDLVTVTSVLPADGPAENRGA